MDDADSVPTIKFQSAKRCLHFTVLISDRWKVVVIHIPEEIFILNGGITLCFFITQGNYIGYMFRLMNSHLQPYSLQVKSQDAVHTLGFQCFYISEIFNGNGTYFNW